jgi:hypothetical protein
MTDISLSGFSLQLLYGEELKCFTMAWLELINGSRIVLDRFDFIFRFD